jgi:SAM-dependent methyltransferase
MAIRPSLQKADPKTFYFAKDQQELVERYDESADVYDEAMSQDVGWSGHIELAAVVGRYVAPDAAMLDAGAGTGMLGDELAKLGFSNMDANDLSPGMLERARGKGIYKDCRVMELGKPLDYADDSYDAVAACGVFTPNHAPANSLDEMIRITKPGGLVLYTLRADETPVDFPPKHDELTNAGAWTLVESCPPFASISSEPQIRHRCWVFRIL